VRLVHGSRLTWTRGGEEKRKMGDGRCRVFWTRYSRKSGASRVTKDLSAPQSEKELEGREERQQNALSAPTSSR
jgi:hypothetical protein